MPATRPAEQHQPSPAARTRVTVALSGGVDSAVAALLLREQGYEVRALFMKNWEEDDGDGECAAARDLADAERVCERLSLPLDTVNFSAEYWEQVFQPMLDGYRAGLTPNPDVLCNREVKFGPFLDFALERGAERVATGHYARIATGADGHPRLLAARDTDKDQSYFLCMLDQQVLARTLFPLGELDKHEVRAIARRAGLGVHDKRDSTGLCFIGPRHFRAFLRRFLATEPGDVLDPNGRVVGRHQGAMLYTVGQRDGLGIGGLAGGNGEPWYVISRDLASNVVTVVQGRDHARLNTRVLHAADACWVTGTAPAMPLRCRARIRHRQPPAACVLGEAPGDRLRIDFDDPQWAPAAGQVAVFYDGDVCLGGAVLDEAPSAT